MKKRLAAALSGSAVLALVLSGCNDDGDDKMNAWADTVCDSVRPQAKKIATANSELQKETSGSSKPEDVRKADINAFRDMSDAYKAIATGLDKAGAPPVDDGEKKRTDVVKELNGVSSSYSDLRQKAEDLDTKDQSAFASGLQEVSQQLGSLSKTGNKALKEFESGDVGKAMQKQKSCQSLSASASPSS
ncbi:small secreted protein [Streptomyces sp. NPDC050560]|uniref:small secreted protein n=1 Tax=Streptomyces sp. NPDC050560 TaxID=3365630 RepID=UPI003792CAB6